MAITEYQLFKLPKYVQEHIKALESEIKQLKDSLDQMGGSVQSDISWTGLGIRGYLPSQATVRFGTYPDGIEVHRDRDTGGVRIRTDEQLLVSARTSNGVTIISVPFGWEKAICGLRDGHKIPTVVSLATDEDAEIRR